MSRYLISGDEGGEFEPNSDEKVLRNHLGISSTQEIEAFETVAYLEAVEDSIAQLDAEQQLSVAYICSLHREWLGTIYPFAGEIRSVNISKGFVAFCPAANLPGELQRLESETLNKCTPCLNMEAGELVNALAEVHVEFVLIHPFREGNGRLARWLTTLMALQGGEPMLDFSVEATDSGKSRYFAALRRGFAGNLEPMRELFAEIIGRTS